MKHFSALFCALTLSALFLTGTSAHAYTKAEAYDACTGKILNGNCQSLRDNLKFYMAIHRQGGPTNDSYLFDTFWNNYVLPKLQSVGESIATNGILKQTTTLGGFLEAQNNVKAQGAIQQGAAEAARNYLPSEALCRFASLSETLAADDAKMRNTQIAIATGSLKRDLGSKNTLAQAGAANDKAERMSEFIREYCNTGHGNLDLMCGSNPQRTFPNVSRDTRYNRDINFTRTLDSDRTVDAEFENSGNLQPAETDIMALSNNLYGDKQLSGRLLEKQMKNRSGQETYLQTRSVAAARNVAQNSYAAIAAMKSQGSGSSREYMKALFTQLGVSDEEENIDLNRKPSYYAQMDVLTKKLYQSPVFYVNLMEGKTNVARQSDAMEGLELMQDRDIYNSMRRSEMLLAVLIQLQSRKELDDVVEGR